MSHDDALLFNLILTWLQTVMVTSSYLLGVDLVGVDLMGVDQMEVYLMVVDLVGEHRGSVCRCS